MKVVAIAVGVIVTVLLSLGVTDALELPMRDAALRRFASQPATTTVVVAIDEPSIRAIGPWPWPRGVLARIVDRAADAQARGVVLDILLAEARDGDEELARAMKRVPTVAVAVLDEHGQWLLPTVPAIPAHGHFELDGDGILRRYATTKQSRDRALVALPVQSASILTHAPVPVGQSIAPAFRTRPRAIPTISAAALLRDPVLGERLRGKLVFVGPTALALGDRVLTPASSLPDAGVLVHAAATESILRGENVSEASPIAGGILAAILAAMLLHTRGTRRLRLLVAAALAVVVVISGIALFALAEIAIPFVVLIYTIILMTAVRELWLMAVSLRRSEEAIARIAERRGRDAESQRLLAHELKTPLASMRSLTQLLGGFELTAAERKRVASLLEAEAGKLQTMVHGLLDLESIPLRDFAATTTLVDFGRVVGARLEFLRAGAERPWTISVPEGLMVIGDAALIERVVDNLVGNAVKHAPDDTPIRIGVHAGDDAAVLEVEDRGPGIADEERQRVFDRFYRGSSAVGTQGLGLGLALVSEVAKWHGGRVEIAPALPCGTVVRFALPFANSITTDIARTAEAH